MHLRSCGPLREQHLVKAAFEDPEFLIGLGRACHQPLARADGAQEIVSAVDHEEWECPSPLGEQLVTPLARVEEREGRAVLYSR